MNTIKICKKHGLLSDENKRSVHKKDRKKPDIRCLICMKESDERYRLKNLEKKALYSLQWTRANRDKVHANYRKTREKHREKQNKNNLAKRKKEVINLTDSYIKSIFTRYGNLKCKDIPQQMIDIKREVIKLRRKIREIKECQK